MAKSSCPSERVADRIERSIAAHARAHYRAVDRAEALGASTEADARRLDAIASGLLLVRLRAVLETHAADHPAEAEALRELEELERAVAAAA